MGFSRQEPWSGSSCPPPGDLPDPAIEPASLMSPALAGRFLNHYCHLGSPKINMLLLLSRFSPVWLCAILWTVACQTPLSMGFSRQELEWVAMPSSRGSSWPRDRTRISYVSCIGRRVLYHWCHLGSLSLSLKPLAKSCITSSLYQHTSLSSRFPWLL